MKSYKSFFLGVIATLVALSFFWAGSAYAATDCFSDISSLPTVFQEAICWMKDNGVTSGYPDGTYKPNGYVTRAQMALFMKNQAQVPPETGQILVTMNPDDWVIGRISTNDLTLAWNFAELQVQGAATSSGYIIGMPDLPASLYGHALSLSGMEVCYGASAAVNLTTVDIFIDTQSNGMGTTYVNPTHDATVRTDNTCRLYTFTPVALSGEKLVSVKLTLDWNTAGSYFYVGRTTFVLTPTTTAVPPLSMPEPSLDTPVMEFPAPRE